MERLTGMEKRMYDAQNHNVKIISSEDDVFIGECTNFVSEYDNDPEEASIWVEKATKNGEPFIGTIVEFGVSDIKEITLLD